MLLGSSALPIAGFDSRHLAVASPGLYSLLPRTDQLGRTMLLRASAVLLPSGVLARLSEPAALVPNEGEAYVLDGTRPTNATLRLNPFLATLDRTPITVTETAETEKFSLDFGANIRWILLITTWHTSAATTANLRVYASLDGATYEQIDGNTWSTTACTTYYYYTYAERSLRYLRVTAWVGSGTHTLRVLKVVGAG